MSGNPDSGFDQLVFQQELNEVYLLLDFISGRPDKHLSSLDGKVEDFHDPSKTMTALAVIERVSSLRYPPDPSEPQKAQDAAFLLKLKDCLNCIAYPARGLTIAYTIMFTEEPDRSGNDRKPAAPPSQNAVQELKGRDPTSGQSDRSAANRTRLAQLAFPSLAGSAKSFRRVKDLLASLALAITVLSAIFLWQVTYGAQLAARFDESKRLDNEVTARLYVQIDHERSGNAAGDAPSDLTQFCNASSDSRPAENAAVTPAHSVAGENGGLGSTIRQLCNEYAYRHALLAVSIDDVGSYSQSWIFQFSDWLLPIHRVCLDAKCGRSNTAMHLGRQEDAQSIAGVSAMMANYMLPILFGLVGTMAALVRGIQDKVTESVLAPRDKALALIRLPLGMMAGVCVGLFLNPTTLTTLPNGGIANFTISASGIAFLAGYGAEGFFRMLDLLITRVFSLRDSDAKAATR